VLNPDAVKQENLSSLRVYEFKLSFTTIFFLYREFIISQKNFLTLVIKFETQLDPILSFFVFCFYFDTSNSLNWHPPLHPFENASGGFFVEFCLNIKHPKFGQHHESPLVYPKWIFLDNETMVLVAISE